MCIHMIGTILCIVFDDKHYTLIPDGAFAEVFDKHNPLPGIVCNIHKGSWFSFAQSFGVIVTQANGLELRDLVNG